MMNESIKDKISSVIELHVGDHTADKLQENQQSEMRLNLMSRFNHRVRHSLEHCCMAARMDGRHGDILEEGELLHGQSLIEVFALNVKADVVVGDGSAAVFCCTEVHSGGVVVLIVNNVHLVVAVVFNIVLLLLEVPAL